MCSRFNYKSFRYDPWKWRAQRDNSPYTGRISAQRDSLLLSIPLYGLWFSADVWAFLNIFCNAQSNLTEKTTEKELKTRLLAGRFAEKSNLGLYNMLWRILKENTKINRKPHNWLYFVCGEGLGYGVWLFPEVIDPTGGQGQQLCAAVAPSNLNLSSMSTETALTCWKVQAEFLSHLPAPEITGDLCRVQFDSRYKCVSVKCKS